MSTSPKRRYYDSKPTSRPTSPPTPAEVRSLAVAKLKRAASLPRNKDGRRPGPSASPSPSPSHAGQYKNAPVDSAPQLGVPTQRRHSRLGSVDSALASRPEEGDREEILSPSPTNSTFDHATMYNDGMQRSGSQTSEFHIPTPPTMMYGHSNGSPYSLSPAYIGSGAGTPDLEAMRLAQSYLPSLSPATLSPSPFATQAHTSSRNTPSPLPTLGDLRTLQRSNSAMARARAMEKLTGGRGTSPFPPPMSADDMAAEPVHGVGLQRSGTVGPRVLQTRQANTPEPPAVPSAIPGTARPRLQRSFTVSSSNMGEERRSAVGRRMVERLAERRAAREQEEAEVRQIWEQKRATLLQPKQDHPPADPQQQQQQQQQPATPPKAPPAPEHEGLDTDVPLVHRSSPAEPAAEQFHPSVTFGGTETHTLGVPDRPVSRETMRSNGGPFEYESHLRRSLSSRTARGAVGVISDNEADPIPAPQGHDIEHLESHDHSSYDDHSTQPHEYQGEDAELTPPRPPFVTPSRHAPHSSTSTDGTVQAGQSPGSDSSQSALNSMMFVMDRGSRAHDATGRPEGNWPHGVEDGGSTEWGTPSRTHEPRTPPTRSPAEHATPDDTPGRSQTYSTILSAYHSSDSTPPEGLPRESVMSWEEVGGQADRKVPSDAHYLKKSGSVSAKLGRSVKDVLRKRSQSRNSVDSQSVTPNSPRGFGEAITNAVQHFSRRGSTSSTSPALPTTQQMSHQPSISSLAPSLTRSDSVSNNSALLQHETHMPRWMPPRAGADDPRIVSSKMSPFPGIAALEERDKSPDVASSSGPKLLHQASDSVVPSLQRTQPAEPIYSLPLPTAGDTTSGDGPKRESADSAQKRSWLAKTFTTPRSSGSVSRKSSVHDASPNIDDKSTTQMPASAPGPGPDPFAAPPLPAPAPVRKMSTSRTTVSPAVSVVHEGNEDRMTRYTATPVARRGEDNSTPLGHDTASKSINGHGIDTGHQSDALRRLDEILALGPDDPKRPDMLDDPPRKLLLSTQVLQVVNTHTAKDRFLLLFNDILIVAKPLLVQGAQATLDQKFIVKSVVPLEQLQISGVEEGSTAEPPRHPVVKAFISHFAIDPLQACRFLTERTTTKLDAPALASLLLKTPELDPTQLGNLLGANEKLLVAYVDRLHLVGVRIDDALRLFLLPIRLPQDPIACDNLLRIFAHRYFHVNRDIVSFDRELAYELVMTIFQLNDALYGTFGFALPNHAITQDVFTSAFHSKDPRSLVDDDLLRAVHDSIRADGLVQALPRPEAGQARDIIITPNRPQTMLTYGIWSDPIYISIARADPSFRIHLLGDGLEFDPPTLDFSNGSEESFRIRGTSLGTKIALLQRTGRNAALYADLGISRSFTVGRAFMQHTFQLSFPAHDNVKRKYCFSVPDSETHQRWVHAMEKQIATAKSKQSRPASSQLRQIAETVSLQVLRNALIPPQAEDPGVNGTHARQGSVSTTYPHMAGREEADLGPLQPGRSATATGSTNGMVDVQTGKELVLLCKQNSLLPGLLALLSAVREDGSGNKGHAHGEDGSRREVRRGPVTGRKF